MQVILTPQRSEAHAVKFTTPPEVIGDEPVETTLTFPPKVPTDVEPQHLPHLRDDFSAGVLIVCRQNKATGRVEYASKLTKQLAIANEAEVFAIATGEAVKSRLAEELTKGPEATERTL